jgi:hypothetical protein
VDGGRFTVKQCVGMNRRSAPDTILAPVKKSLAAQTARRR